MRRSALFAGALAVIAVHAVDDNFVQPQPGTTAGDHLVSGLVPLAALALAAWAYPRLSAGRRRRAGAAVRALRDLRELVPEIAPRPLLLIHAGIATERVNEVYHRIARPAEYERRVVGFLDAALLR